jgi:predicted dinucleotide-binding enzyme
MTTTKIGIIGDGRVGRALARGLKRAGREARIVGSDKPAIRDTAAWATVIITAIPFAALGDLVHTANDALDGKAVVDVTNALGVDGSLALGFTTSGAEELQKMLPRAHVVKAFNTVFARHMDTGRLGDQQLTAFVAGDDPAAKAVVLALAADIGFDAVDAGPLKNARMLEPLGVLNIQLGHAQKMGATIGFELLHS